jgi:cell division protein ZapB
LTVKGFSNYSASMDADLKRLEDKLVQLIALCQNLRAENAALHQDLAQAQNETKKLKDNIAVVSTRLEAVIDRLPEESV